jgi:hypothetical protein
MYDCYFARKRKKRREKLHTAAAVTKLNTTAGNKEIKPISIYIQLSSVNPPPSAEWSIISGSDNTDWRNTWNLAARMPSYETRP